MSSEKSDKKALTARLPKYDSKNQPQGSGKSGDSIDVKAIKFTLNAPYSAWDEREKAEFTVYPVKATITRDDSSSSTVDVLKRYSQFDELHEALEKRYKKVKLPEMPPKKWFGNTDPEFVNERAKKLEVYLNKVGIDPILVKSEDLARFLHSTMVLTNISGNPASSPPTSPRADANQISTPVSKPAAADAAAGKSEPGPRLSSSGFSTPAAGAGGAGAAGAGGKPAAVAAMGGGSQARALYDFAASSETELTLRTGDVVTLISTQDSAWWYGQLPNGKLGYFPSNYVAKQP